MAPGADGLVQHRELVERRDFGDDGFDGGPGALADLEQGVLVPGRVELHHCGSELECEPLLVGEVERGQEVLVGVDGVAGGAPVAFLDLGVDHHTHRPERCLVALEGLSRGLTAIGIEARSPNDLVERQRARGVEQEHQQLGEAFYPIGHPSMVRGQGPLQAPVRIATLKRRAAVPTNPG